MRFLILATLVAVCAAAAFAKDGALTDEDRADLAWFEGLGYPKADPSRFVRLSTGGVGSPSRAEGRGFVLAADDAGTRLLTVGLEEWTIERDPLGTPDGSRRLIEPLDVRDECEAWLAGGPSPVGVDQFPFVVDPSVATRVLVVAAALAPKEPALVHDLLAHARTLRRPGWRGDREDATRPLRERAAAHLADVELVRARMALVGMSLPVQRMPRSRAEQRDAFRRVAERFPGTKPADEARAFADVLDRMVRDDAERAKAAAPVAERSEDDRIRELIFRLREDTPWEFGAMGGPGPIVRGPYRELVKLGRAAVPFLIEALADDALTRYGGEGRSGMDPYVFDVGDVALMAIEEIAGHSFAPPASADLPRGERRAYRAAFRAACRPAVAAWFAEVQAGREFEDLERRVAEGDWQAATTLLARDPSRGRAALVRALATQQATWIRDEYLGLLAKDPGDEGLGVLRREATSGEPWTRYSATMLLAGLHDEAAPDALLALWRERRDGGGPSTRTDGGLRLREDEVRTIAAALLATKRADLVAALADGLPRRAAAVRAILVEELAKARDGATDDAAAAIDDALAQGLDDFTEYDAAFGWRVRDAAAAALAKTRGLAAPQPSDPPAARDRAVDDVAGAWVREHSLAPRERTPPSPSTPTPDDEVPAAQRPFVVREVRVVPAGATVPARVRAKLDALLGRPLTATAFADVVRTIVHDVPHGASLDAWRGAGEPGVVVTYTAQDGPGGGWSVTSGALRGDRPPEPREMAGWSLDEPRDDGDVARRAETALAAAPDERAWIHVLVARRSAD